MDLIILLIRLGLAGIFGVAGIGKLLDRKGAEKALEDFGVPASLAVPSAVFLPLAELLIAVLLLFNQTSWAGAIGGGTLLAVFIGGMVVQLVRGNAPDCHCFGQIHSEPVGWKSLIRNILFFLGAGFLVFLGAGGQGTDLFSGGNNPQILIGLGIIALLGIIVFYLKQISDQQNKILRRIEVLEVISAEGFNRERDDLGHPEDGLPLGAPAPGFQLEDINGKIVEFEHLLAGRKPILFFFVSPSCSPCAALLPEIGFWREKNEGRVEMVFISSGKTGENREKFEGAGVNTVLIEKNREIAGQFGAVWTPSAVLVNRDGTVASRIATGDTAIRELLERIASEVPEKNIVFIANGNDPLRKSKIGEKVPAFKLEDLGGKIVGTEDFLGKKTLVTFWSMTCPHCVRMLEELRNWDRQKGLDEPNLLVFSDGDAGEHSELGLDSPIVLDKDYKTSIKLGMVGTPSAVLVNEKGEIASETAVGAPQIWALIGKRIKGF